MKTDSLATRDARIAPPLEPRFELRFGSLFDPGRAYTFPCDVHGQVPLDRLPQPQRQSFLRVLQLVGREFGSPVVAPSL